MDFFFDWYLWMFPLLGFFAILLTSNKKKYSLEHNTIDSSFNSNSIEEYRVSKFFAIIVFLAMILIAGFRDRWYADTTAYVYMFEEWPNKLSEVFLTGEERYPGFLYFTVFIKQYISTDFRVWLVIIATISISCLALTYRKYTSEIVLCAFLFFSSTDFHSWTMNGIRQFLVVSILFALTPLLFKNRLFGYIIFIVLGLLLYYFHISVLIALPIYFVALGKPLNKKTITVMLFIVLVITFLDQFTTLMSDVIENTSYKSSVTEIISNVDGGTNIFRVLFYSIPTVFLIIFRHRIPDNIPNIIKYSMNMSMVGSAFYLLSFFTSGIFLGRIPIYFTLFNYILIPWEINNLVKQENKKLVYYALIIMYLVFYIYQQYTWNSGIIL